MVFSFNTISHRRQTYHINLVDQTHIQRNLDGARIVSTRSRRYKPVGEEGKRTSETVREEGEERVMQTCLRRG